ncbi:MAG: glycosyltransferase family 4 protein [Gammaproteobacteria bacterium]|nr:glycosyltransferase family 4 protein [Gammaproteobacteria bacterium]
MKTDSKKVLFFVSEDWYFCSHRLSLALAIKDAGYQVSVVTNVRSHGDAILKAGLKLIPLELSRKGMNPFCEFQVIRKLVSIYKNEQPDIVHHVALKPVIYGSIASRIASIPFRVNALAGLGFLFTSKILKARIGRMVAKISFRMLFKHQGTRVILQNPDDLQLMADNKVPVQHLALIRGSGVELKQFTVQPEQAGDPLVILASRLLWDKGVLEFVAAARELKAKGIQARFALVGKGDNENPNTISSAQLQKWEKEGAVELWGERDDMPDVFAQSHIVCLPSTYGEGVPKVLLEAAACGRPIVTTDTPGCRDVVKDGYNGFLVPVRDIDAVVEAVKKLLFSPEQRKQMGLRGREVVENGFSVEQVNRETLALYDELMGC